jgi:hypothetical protein
MQVAGLVDGGAPIDPPPTLGAVRCVAVSGTAWRGSAGIAGRVEE